MQPAMAFRFASTDQENNGDTGKTWCSGYAGSELHQTSLTQPSFLEAGLMCFRLQERF